MTEQQIGRLSCCPDGAKFVGLRHAASLFYETEYANRADFLKRMRETPPAWTIHAKTFVTRWEHSDEVSKVVAFCPFCGTKVPDVRLRTEGPEKICVVLDGGYRCNTCKERLVNCECSLPERLWEAAPCIG